MWCWCTVLRIRSNDHVYMTRMLITMITAGWWWRYPCFTSGSKKPILKSEKVPQVRASLHLKIILAPILANNQLWLIDIFTQLISFSAWKRLEVVRSMWTLTPRRTCDWEQPLNTCCDPVKVPSQAVTLLRTFLIKWSNVQRGFSVLHLKDQIQLDWEQREIYHQ